MSKNELIIKKENEIIIIRKENVQQLVHEPEYLYEGFAVPIGLHSIKSFTPLYNSRPEQYFVVMTNGDKFNLTKKQYQVIKKWY